MATIGHGFLGLACAGLTPLRTGRMRLRFLLPGVMVLCAYAMDVAEWVAVILNPDLIDRRFFSHSPLAAAVLAIGACLALGTVFRMRCPRAFLLVAVAVASHLFLDLPRVRVSVAELYAGTSLADAPAPVPTSLLAEACLYGLPLVLVLLGQSSVEGGSSPRARSVSRVLVPLCIAAAATRHAAVWVPLYVLSITHAGLLLRRHLHANLIWNLVPLVPVFALVVTAGMVSHRRDTARSLRAKGLYYEAIAVYQTALRLPCRDGKTMLYVEIGTCYEEAGDLGEAERAYRMAGAWEGYPGVSELKLARFYQRHQGTPFYRPEEAVRRYEKVISAASTPQRIKAAARVSLRRLRERD